MNTRENIKITEESIQDRIQQMNTDAITISKNIESLKGQLKTYKQDLLGFIKQRNRHRAYKKKLKPVLSEIRSQQEKGVELKNVIIKTKNGRKLTLDEIHKINNFECHSYERKIFLNKAIDTHKLYINKAKSSLQDDESSLQNLKINRFFLSIKLKFNNFFKGIRNIFLNVTDTYANSTTKKGQINKSMSGVWLTVKPDKKSVTTSILTVLTAKVSEPTLESLPAIKHPAQDVDNNIQTFEGAVSRFNNKVQITTAALFKPANKNTGKSTAMHRTPIDPNNIPDASEIINTLRKNSILNS